MSDMTVSNQSIRSMAIDNQARSIESGSAGIGSDARLLNTPELKSPESERTDVAGQVASRTDDFFGNGTDLSSTGTDNDIQRGIVTALQETGIGTIADEVA